MYIKFKGEDLGEWKGAPRIKEARTIKRVLGMNPAAFMEAITEMDPDALSLLISLLYARNNKEIPYQEIDGEITDLVFEPTEEEKREQVERESAVISPAISAALRELGLDVIDARVTSVVLKHLEEATEKQGKEEAETTPSTTSTDLMTTT